MKSFLLLTLNLFLMWGLSGCGGAPAPSPSTPSPTKSNTFTSETATPPPKPVIKKAAKELFLEAGTWASGTPPQYQKAIDLYKKAYDEDSNLVDAVYNIGLVYEMMGNEQKAIEWYQKAGAYRVANGWVNIGLIYKRKGELQQAAQFFRKATQISRVHSQANLNLAVLYLDYPNQFQSTSEQSARKFVRKALQEDNSNADAYEVLAQLYYKQKRYQLGLLVCQSGLTDLDPKHAGLWNLQALIYLKLNEVSQAVVALNNALKFNPNHFGALLNLGIIKYGYRDYQASYSLLKQAVEIKPNHIEAVLSKAVTARSLKRFDEAVQGYQKVLQLSPNHPGALFNIAVYNQDFKDQNSPNQAKTEDAGLNTAKLKSAVKEYENVLQYAKTPSLRKKITNRIREIRETLAFEE
jgi:tetratricopeptide (TPR) repeat protein